MCGVPNVSRVMVTILADFSSNEVGDIVSSAGAAIDNAHTRVMQFKLMYRI